MNMNRTSFLPQRLSAHYEHHFPNSNPPDTAPKAPPNKRFSYQDTQRHHNQLLKENISVNRGETGGESCLNHPKVPAVYLALGHTADPMPLCQRCAILVASKGFEVAKLPDSLLSVPEHASSDFRSALTDTFNSIKRNKQCTFESLSVTQAKLRDRQAQIESQFDQIQRLLDGRKSCLLREVNACRKQVEGVKHEANRYYMGLLEKVRQVSRQNSKVPSAISSQFAFYLQELARSTFKLPGEGLTALSGVPAASAVGRCLGVVLQVGQGKQVRRQSSARSLQLSFEESLQGEGGVVVDSKMSSDMLGSMSLF